MMRLWLTVVCAVGCTPDFGTVTCADGRVCPAGTLCDDTHGLCVTPDQLDACRGVVDGDNCMFAGSLTGVCQEEVCLPAKCGDGFLIGTEQCDGDNLGAKNCSDFGFYDREGLVCGPMCTHDTSACTGFCGDAAINGPEQCDGGATTCQARGFTNGGAIACNSGCVWDTSSCSN